MDGLNGPPSEPVEAKPAAGLTNSWPGRDTDRVTLRITHAPVVTSLNLTVAEYDPPASELAALLTDTAMSVLAPAARVPLAADRSSHEAFLPTAQLNEFVSVLFSV